jgi:ATP-dependent helicase/nuclease subunit A
MEGRRKLLLRLGPEARDPIEELLASALEFETTTAPSLQRFLDWFARGDVEIVRDPSAPLDAVRVMTVHGSKGLQSPVVILADACVDPNRARGSSAELTSMTALPSLSSAPGRRACRALEVADRDSGQARPAGALALLYVAMTRAEERLYVGGSLGPADRKGPPQGSWYQAVEDALSGLGCEPSEDALWGKARLFGDAEKPGRAAAAAAAAATAATRPAWLSEAAPPEARPPRPLAPSAVAEDDVPYPPPSPEMREAAERGRLLHLLFERLPGVAADDRRRLADAWLERSVGVEDAELRRRLIEDACRIISDPAHAGIFGPEALAEAPIAAVTPDGSVITGTVDRLLVADRSVRLVDFKTGRRVPANAAEIAPAHLRQMAAYVAALEVIFPGRTVEAALLYTSGPKLHPLPPDLLAPYRPAAPALADG